MHLCFQNITKHILMGISFAKGVERPITVMGIEKKHYRSVSVGQRVTVCWLAICLVFRPHSRYILTNARMTQYSGGTWMRVTVRSACVRDDPYGNG